MQVHPSGTITNGGGGSSNSNSNSNKDEIHVISFEGCPFAQRTQIQLLAKGIPFKTTNIDLKNKPDWFLAMNPLGKVPVIQHGDKVLFESSIIAEYIEDLYANDPSVPQLLPKDPYQRAVARFWIDFANNKLIPAAHKLIWETDPEKQAPIRADILNLFKFLSNYGLKNWKGPYFFGEQYTIVDIAYSPFLERLDVVWKNFRNFDTSEELVGPAIAQWSKNTQQHESFKPTASDPQFLINMYQNYASIKKRQQQQQQ